MKTLVKFIERLLGRGPGQPAASPLFCVLLAETIVVGLFVGLCVGTQILVSGDLTGRWWALLILAYLGGMFASIYHVRRRRELLEERALFGDELFFSLYPRELRRELRRLKSEERRRLREGARQGR